MEKPEKEVIIYRESALQSVVADTYSFVVFFAVMAGNHFLLADNKTTYFIFLLVILIFIIGKSSARKHTFTDLDKAIEFLKSKNNLP